MDTVRFRGSEILGVRIATIQTDNIAIRCAFDNEVIDGLPFRVTILDPVAPEAAVRRWTALGTPLGGADLRVDVERALRACTIDAAWACHRERLVGSIEPGKLADLAILSADPTGVPPDRIGSIAVEETWLAGEPAT